MAMATERRNSETDSIERGYRSLNSLFRPPGLDSKKCHRCKGAVYHAEKTGPVHDVVFHKSCFKCHICGMTLSLKNYWSNQVDAEDREIYCQTHAPRIGAASLGEGAIGIKRAMDVQKDYRKVSAKQSSQFRPPGTMRVPTMDIQAISMKRALTVPKVQDYRKDKDDDHGKRVVIGADALHIRGPIDAQLMRQGYQRKLDKHHFPPYIYKKREKLFDAQKRLEEEHRKVEDEAYQLFEQEKKQENRKLSQELHKEWEIQLKALTEKFQSEFDKKQKKMKDSEKKQMTIQFENQKKDLEKDILIVKKEKEQMTRTMKLRQKQERITAEMVKKQSQEMLELIAAKQEELKRELEQELTESTPSDVNMNGQEQVEELEVALEALEVTPVVEKPSPHPPSSRKKSLYTDPKVFDDVDEQVIMVAENEQVTYTDLVRQLTESLVSDLEKARAIYRWITVKDLNIMDFKVESESDTPMGLLRGIKSGTETYHVLFMRLCSYVGLHCVEIKGHSKSVGYEPGMKLQPDQFLNTWNAVLIDGDWRLVQCNWGARHLVMNKDNKEKKVKEKTRSRDKIRYQYDEHYFLTDPDQFIQEFWPFDSQWQLLEKPITKEEFEALPFVRSVFFHFALRFDHKLTAVLDADEKGGADIKIKIPEELENELVFYYQLRFADKERRQDTLYRGATLERFVFQTMIENTVMFSVHVPTTGEFFFEIFSNKLEEAKDDAFQGLTPFRLKCACKFKIICKSLSGKMHPLPDCASGEWGPKKGSRHFGIKPIYIDHPLADDSSDAGSSSESGEFPDNPKAGIVNVEDKLELKFQLTKPLHVVAKLKMNFCEDKVLDPFVSVTVDDSTAKVTVNPPQIGQYGLDIYAKPKNATDLNTLSHACKYLLNANKVSSPVDIPKIANQSKKEKWGPTSYFEEMGLKTVSHKDPRITATGSNQLTIVLNVPEKVQLSHTFMREPDEDNRDYVSMVRDSSDPQNVRFFVNLPTAGNYMLSLYARQNESDDTTRHNIYNYLIISRKNSPEVANGKSERSSIFRKNLFKKDKDEKKEKNK